MSRPRIGFIIQRYGPEIVGGAEALCRAIAKRLAPHWDIEVLTTCAVDHMTWANALPAGTSDVDGVTVHRFPVDRMRNVEQFNRHNTRILMKFHSLEAEKHWMKLQGPQCFALQAYAVEQRDEFDGFLLFNYLYATSYESHQRLADRYFLVPFAHDEPPIYLRLFDDLFRSARGIMFCTEEERDFARRRFPFALPPAEVIGMGVTPPDVVDGERFCAKYDIQEPFLLYAGRIDPSKGCDDLLRDFAAYRARAGATEHSLSLVLCGSSQLTIPRRDDIRYLGFVDEADKWDAMAAARCLVLPSFFESLSIVLLEAWATGTPVLVNGRCEVSVGQCRRSGGGLWYKNRDEFVAAADWLARDATLCKRLGHSGREFVNRHYRWPKIIERCLQFIRFD